MKDGVRSAPEKPVPGVTGVQPARETELARLERVARVLDASVRVPGTPLSVGLDSLIGLVPLIGDLATTFVSLWIVYRGWRLGARRATVARMLGNVGLDFLIGSVPLAGDLFDVAWKANLRNVRLLRRELGPPDAAASGEQRR